MARCRRATASGGETLTRKGDVIRALIELSTWRRQLRYATKAKRYDLALVAVDNCFALTSKALRAMLKNAPRRTGVRRRSAAVRPATPRDETSPDAPSSR